MKASELRVGNLIWVDDNIVPTYIHAVTAEDIFDLDRGAVEAKGAKAQPIPLTEEWLLRLGFVRWSAEEWMFPGDEWFMWSDGYITVDGGLIIAHAKHVHELQNAVYIMVRKELTIKE